MEASYWEGRSPPTLDLKVFRQALSSYSRDRQCERFSQKVLAEQTLGSSSISELDSV
ncbi:hypothetical protein [Chamaesiphon minutus]|uniref:Uncharacterized protein n=1 Tax=Chamaesiphon minutus (strain ATCC 27169 / PCC 6605) TaxID=1173020 RepID=K9UFL3_CHAP6|nr:hypothetical protein [Chamaesiphon minutus]AFY93892.1 hypothetical protein Cha6605_2856 [Chamaesiphon minutus PCC 6605]